MVRPGGLLHRGSRRPDGRLSLDQGARSWFRGGSGGRSVPKGGPGGWVPPGEKNEQSLGEVYVVGVDPAEQGSGLGRALTLAGLRHLRDLGVAQAMLYVDEDNVPAIRMYEALGFTRATVDAMYRRKC